MLTFSDGNKFELEKHDNVSKRNMKEDRKQIGILCRVHNNLDNIMK